MREETIQLTVKVRKHTAEQIKKLADYNSVGVAEQLRMFIDKGLSIQGYSQDVDFITGIIRQEMMAIYHIDDIKAVVKDQNNRIAKMLMKSSKLSSASYFLLLKLVMGFSKDISIEEAVELTEDSILLGVNYMQKKDFIINNYLFDTDNLMMEADNL